MPYVLSYHGFSRRYTPSFLNFSNVPPLFVQPAEVLPPLRRVFVHFVEKLGVDKFAAAWYNGRAPRAPWRGLLYTLRLQKSIGKLHKFTQFFPLPICALAQTFLSSPCTKAGQIFCAICTLYKSRFILYNYLCKRLGNPATKSEKS